MAWRYQLRRLRAEVRGWSDGILLARVALLAIVLLGLLRFLGLSRLMRILTPPATRPGSAAVDAQRVVRLTDLALARLPLVRSTCLLRSLVLYRLLRTGGLPVQVHFGVQRTEDRLAGHSWLTLHGQPLPAQAGADSFAEIYVYPVGAGRNADRLQGEGSLCA